jgi:hypothetical protein
MNLLVAIKQTLGRRSSHFSMLTMKQCYQTAAVSSPEVCCASFSETTVNDSGRARAHITFEKHTLPPVPCSGLYHPRISALANRLFKPGVPPSCSRSDQHWSCLSEGSFSAMQMSIDTLASAPSTDLTSRDVAGQVLAHLKASQEYQMLGCCYSSN